MSFLSYRLQYIGDYHYFFGFAKIITMSLNHLSDLLSEDNPGQLRFGGARMALLDIEAGFWSVRNQVEALIGPHLTNSVLQQAGANGGASLHPPLEMALTLASRDNSSRVVCNPIKRLGLGNLKSSSHIGRSDESQFMQRTHSKRG